MSEELFDVQFRIADLEESVSALTEASIKQENRIKVLEKQIEHLAKQLKSSSGISNDDDQPPPHY